MPRTDARIHHWVNQTHTGDVRAVLRRMIEDKIQVDAIVTSPPYWGLRSYLPAGHPDKHLEIGSEPTLREFLATMTGVFDLCRQVLKKRGTMWVNMGDSYAGSRSGPDTGSTLQGTRANQAETRTARQQMVASRRRDDHPIPRSDMKVDGLKNKDLVGQPWRLAFALQDDGWWLRQDVIWHKPNPMPESATDRCTKAHEYLFLLAKSAKYYWDADAFAEPTEGTAKPRRSAQIPAGWATGTDRSHHESLGRYSQLRNTRTGVGWGYADDAPKPRTVGEGAYREGKSVRLGREPGWRNKVDLRSIAGKQNASYDAAIGRGGEIVTMRNRRSVWTIQPERYAGAHFATFPSELIEPCILASVPPGGIVLDPFMGSGTTAQVAEHLNRRFIGIDLDERNGRLQAKRTRQRALNLEAA